MARRNAFHHASSAIHQGTAGYNYLAGTGNRDYTDTGSSTVNGGTLQFEKAAALGATSGAVSVISGATLALVGSGTTFAANALALNGGGASQLKVDSATAFDATFLNNASTLTATNVIIDAGVTLTITTWVIRADYKTARRF